MRHYLGFRATVAHIAHFFVAICYCSPNIRQLLRNPLRLSISYCTTITLFFLHDLISPDFHLWLRDCVINTTCFLTTLGTFFYSLLFLTLAPRDHVTYYQAQGLSVHTSPCCECAFLIKRLHPGTGCLLGWSSAFLLLWTLAPRDYVTYCQARGLSGHTSSCGECVFLISGLHPGTGCLLG